MGDIDSAEVGRTYDCKTPDCTGEASSPVGRYSYCSACRDRRASMAPRSSKPVAVGGFATRVRALEKQAKDADKLAAHAKTLTERALEAKRNADAAATRVRELARDLMGE